MEFVIFLVHQRSHQRCARFSSSSFIADAAQVLAYLLSSESIIFSGNNEKYQEKTEMKSKPSNLLLVTGFPRKKKFLIRSEQQKKIQFNN
jgi:hypothetical protein